MSGPNQNQMAQENYESDNMDFSKMLIPECIQPDHDPEPENTNQLQQNSQNPSQSQLSDDDSNSSGSSHTSKHNNFPNQIYVDIENNVIWNDIDRNFQPVPLYLKRCMIFSGFDNYFSIADLTEKDICDVEQLIRSNFKSLVHHTTRDESGNLMNYFHIYADTPDQFSIVKGHQKLLLRIREYVSRKGARYFSKVSKHDSGLVEEVEHPYCSNETINNIQEYTNFSNGQSMEFYRSPMKTSSIKQEVESDLQTEQEEDDDNAQGEYSIVVQDKLVKIGSLSKARNKLTEIANRWLQNFSKLKNVPIDSIETAKVSYHEKRGFLGMIPCNQCNHFIRISTQTLPNGSTRWITSNFTKHYMRHFEKPIKREHSDSKDSSFEQSHHM